MNKIILDGSKLSVDVAGGVVTYVNNLFEKYQIHEGKYHIESRLLLLHKLPNGCPLVLDEHKPKRRSIVKTSFQFAKSMIFGVREEYSLFHSPYMFLPPKLKGKINLLTVLDMINFEKSLGMRNMLREFFLRLAIKRADFYVCISEATKEKLQTYFPSIKDHQILVTHLGIDNNFLSPSTSTHFANLVDTPYLLYVGQRGGYKNFTSLIPFMAQSAWGKKLKILCVGGGPFSKKELMLLNRHQLHTVIQHVGYSSTEDLKFLYQHALALTYTSLQEGFGLPILEAMASGCPVICGNFSSMREISGSHAILVDNFSVKSLEKAMGRVSATQKSDTERARLYAATFSWEKTAIRTLSLYATLLASVQKGEPQMAN